MLTPRGEAEVRGEGELQQGRDRRSRRRTGRRNSGLERERVERGAAPILIELGPLEAGAEPARAQASVVSKRSP